MTISWISDRGGFQQFIALFFFMLLLLVFFYKLVLQICICWWQNTFHQNMTREHRKDITVVTV